ncbi:uncharacterized protein I303_106818 [Kwoniella dejecticola CBS 10117]|uniref:Uncharacterized protein n=1 Tax=Kwoniella dejecticola CBS 10117 TaxID=1296121 RepID=A0A1A5ZTQ2_9TREE|nr:uncharacterized protein I303_08539 [Kwoniella dejecticola CBS 10117]OBR81155.1 hypothetical protein I303_08539 [Kwoniella dejecticola CBS 10117]
MKFTLPLVALLASLSLTAAAPSRRAAMPEATGFVSRSSPDSAEYLESLSSHQANLRTNNEISKGKIVGVGHHADDIPLRNSERIQRGLPLKPPARKAKRVANIPTAKCVLLGLLKDDKPPRQGPTRTTPSDSPLHHPMSPRQALMDNY